MAFRKIWHSFLSDYKKNCMTEDRLDPQLQRHENVEENPENENNRFESDAQKIIHRHLENEKDIITDEDIASVRVGAVNPQFDEATAARFEDEEPRKETEDKLLEGTEDMKIGENLKDRQTTPWDAIDAE